MEMLLVCGYDCKAEFYTPPKPYNNRPCAIRDFEDLVNSGSGMVSQHPEDYSIFEIGKFDTTTAKLELLPQPVRLCTGLEVKHNG